MPQSSRMWLDGEMVDGTAPHVSLLTHALHYGTGVFEGIRTYRGRGASLVFRLRDHLERLQLSARALGLGMAFTNDDLAQASLDVLAANHLEEAYIRPLVFVGQGSMSLDIEVLPANPVHVLIAAWQWKSYFRSRDHGLSLKVSDWKRCFARSGLNTIKSAGFYVNSYLAHRDARQSGFDDAILLDEAGAIAEATAANVFLVSGETLVTPRAVSALPGITRHTVITLARDLGLDVDEREIDVAELQRADEVFLTGTACEIAPVAQINDHRISAGTCGQITAKLADSYHRVVRNDYVWVREPPPPDWWAPCISANPVTMNAAGNG